MSEKFEVGDIVMTRRLGSRRPKEDNPMWSISIVLDPVVDSATAKLYLLWSFTGVHSYSYFETTGRLEHLA